ncbi:MAG: 2-oxo acid dehydrogenase subunit E2 [Anaerolineales bacterium]|nr:2-oxo acid dehydrogenase subunit E2 [Anaerolineales bacterium]
MAKAVIMPKFGFTQESAQIVRWLKKAGDAVEQGDPIAEVTTDKVNMEVEAPESGILDGLRFQEGDTVPVTEIIAYLRAPNETLAASAQPAGAAPAAAVAAAPAAATAATPVAAKLAQDLGVDVSQVAGTGPGGRVTRRDVEAAAAAAGAAGGRPRAVPAARRLARELGVDLAAVPGSGPHGRVQSADVKAAAESAAASVPAAAPAASPAPAGVKVIPLVGMRRTIATRLQKSFQDAPHIFFDAEIDVTAAEALRAAANARQAKEQPKLSLTVLIAKACAWALGRHPLLNSWLVGDEIRVLDAVNLGVAVALEDGLIVPVVKDVAHKGLAQLAVEIAGLAERARTNRLRPDDVADGTFTISNLGMFGVDRFTAILNPPQVGILAVSRARSQFVPDAHGQPVARPLMTVTLSADHRVVDGAVAARFLKDLRDGLEQPSLLLV